MAQSVEIHSNKTKNSAGNPLYVSSSYTAKIFTGHQKVEILGTATLIPKIDADRRYLRLSNLDQNYDIFLGDSAVTSGDGSPIYMSSTIEIEVNADSDIYAVLGAVIPTGDLRILEFK